MGGLIAAMFFATFLGMCIYARVRAKSALLEDLRVRSLVDTAMATSIRDAPREGAVLLTGRVSGAEGAVISAPFSNDEAVWAQAEAHTNVGQVIDSWVRKVETLVLDDRSGRVANVELAGATVRLPAKSVFGPTSQLQVATYFESIGRSPGSGEFYYEAVLRPGDTVSVLAKLAPSDVAYRESAASLRLTNDAGELLVFDPDVDANAPALHRRHIDFATYGIVIFAIATAISLAVGVLR